MLLYPLVRESSQGIFILAVGTPIVDGKSDESHLTRAASDIAKNLAPGDLVLLRSTVKAFTSATTIIPLLEDLSGMKCGREFFYAVAPERTAEGVALQELELLPQLVGADDEASTLSCNIFSGKDFPTSYWSEFNFRGRVRQASMQQLPRSFFCLRK